MESVTIGKATLFLGDCMEGLQDTQGKAFDLAIVDPPYGINSPNMQMGSHPNRSKYDGFGSGPAVSTAVKLKGRLNQGGGKLKNRLLNQSDIAWDCAVPTQEYFDKLFFVSWNQIIWGGNYFPLRPTRCVVCWDKCQPWENFSQWEMAWTSFDKPAALYRCSNTGGANKETKIHPTQKPIPLYKWLLYKFAKPDQLILDTHMGSGSSVIAALSMGFPITAFETNPEYFYAACERIERAQQQLHMPHNERAHQQLTLNNPP